MTAYLFYDIIAIGHIAGHSALRGGVMTEALVLFALALTISWGALAIAERDKIADRWKVRKLQFKRWRSTHHLIGR